MTADDAINAPPVLSEPKPARRVGIVIAVAVGLVVVLIVLGVVGLLRGGSGGQESVALIPATASEANTGMALTDAVETLPDFELTEFGGDAAVPVNDLLGGQPLVLNFWATWCAPCVAEMPEFEQVHQAGGEAFRLVGINTRDAAINAEPFAEELGITYDLLVDRQGDYFTMTGGFGMPTTLFVEPDGTVAYRHTGPLGAEEFIELLDERLGVVVDAS